MGLHIRNRFEAARWPWSPGAGGVLCRMFARTLSEAGAAVALLDINEEAAAKAADEITRLGGRAVAYRADVMDKEELESVHARVLAQLGPCDILVNGAAAIRPAPTQPRTILRWETSRRMW